MLSEQKEGVCDLCKSFSIVAGQRPIRDEITGKLSM